MGNRLYKNKGIERKESLSKVNFQNAIDFFIYHGIRGSDDTRENRALTPRPSSDTSTCCPNNGLKPPAGAGQKNR